MHSSMRYCFSASVYVRGRTALRSRPRAVSAGARAAEHSCVCVCVCAADLMEHFSKYGAPQEAKIMLKNEDAKSAPRRAAPRHVPTLAARSSVYLGAGRPLGVVVCLRWVIAGARVLIHYSTRQRCACCLARGVST